MRKAIKKLWYNLRYYKYTMLHKVAVSISNEERQATENNDLEFALKLRECREIMQRHLNEVMNEQ